MKYSPDRIDQLKLLLWPSTIDAVRERAERDGVRVQEVLRAAITAYLGVENKPVRWGGSAVKRCGKGRRR